MGCGTSISDHHQGNFTSSPKKKITQQNMGSSKQNNLKQNESSKAELKKINKVQTQKINDNQQIQSIVEDIKMQSNPFNSPNKQINQGKQIQVNESMYQPLPQIKQGKIYLFGQSSQQRKIISFNCEQLKFTTVASRSMKVEQNVKYQPSDIIFQESQQLQASHLYNKYSHPPYNFMFATYLNNQKIFLCGGINADFQYISDETFIYNIGKNQKNQNSTNGPVIHSTKGNNLIGLKFDKLQYMNRKRYSHMGTFFQIGKLGYVYIFGGRGQNHQTMTHCEKYSIEERKWTQISPMKVPRSTGFSLIFCRKIYICGGYTDQKKRTKKIQVYDPFKNYWEMLDVKLHRGIEAALMFSMKPNEILIMGGNMQLGSLKSVIKVNLAQKTYIWDSNMKNQRFLQKGGKFNDQVYIFGGDFQDSFEKYTLKDRKWRDQQIQYKSFILPDDINAFTLASQTIQVKFDETLISKNEPVSDFQRIHIFGNDQYPVILQINLNKWVLKKKAVPMSLRLRCHMTIVKIKQGKYLVMGGIDSFDQKCSRGCFIYYAGTNKAIQTEKINQKKYQMASCVYEDFVYSFGGRNSKNGQILSICEKFSLTEQKWIPLKKNLSRQRAKAKTLVHNSKIFIWGGCDSLQNINEIQIFDPKTQQFTLYFRSIPISSQIKEIIKSPVPNSNQIMIFSFNDLLNEQYCHTCNLENEKQNPIEKKQQQNGLICSSDLSLKQVKAKISTFNSVFKFGQNVHFITSKGILTWKYETNNQTAAVIKPQIIINQVEMLQYPIEKFSFSN